MHVKYTSVTKDGELVAFFMYFEDAREYVQLMEKKNEPIHTAS